MSRRALEKGIFGFGWVHGKEACHGAARSPAWDLCKFLFRVGESWRRAGKPMDPLTPSSTQNKHCASGISLDAS
ncbi:uncharacterized [Tachysurus ichikawai]